jgi:Resolvase, N terminal domain
VVHKVDRLTRSLADFAKLFELFDGHGVSFVSVTQQFNTTTSMGRLTLNVLLSFAQFEREVTSERIRDKIAASKRKGLWVGGIVPLGYATKDRKIVVVEEEAERVRTIFRSYLRLGSLNHLMADLRERGIVTKVRSLKTGRTIEDGGLLAGKDLALVDEKVAADVLKPKPPLAPSTAVPWSTTVSVCQRSDAPASRRRAEHCEGRSSHRGSLHSGGTIDEALACQERKCFVSSGEDVFYPCIFFSRI